MEMERLSEIELDDLEVPCDIYLNFIHFSN